MYTAGDVRRNRLELNTPGHMWETDKQMDGNHSQYSVMRAG